MKIQDDNQRVLSRIQSAGELQQHLNAFATELLENHYTLLSTRAYLRSASYLGRWMASVRVGVDEICEEVLAKFARHQCACPGQGRHRQLPSRRNMARVRRFVSHLQRRGAVAVGPEPPLPEVPAALVGFRAWLAHHGGLTARTIDQYVNRVERMLPALGNDPSQYNARLMRQVILTESRDRSRGYLKTFVTALRAFVRFLAAHDKCPPYLDRAVPVIREWKLSALPRYLEADDVERVIASCDQNHAQGLRDRAVLLLLARLGLRAGDIVALRIDDLDWERGTVRVRGKALNEIRLPLPQDAGDAVAGYLRGGRPSGDCERVFLCSNAPVRPFATSSVVAAIVRCALDRTGIANPPSRGAHLLRHSAATSMLRSGASLDSVATVLRHESSDMTAHYAKVDLTLLEGVAQPWPEDASC